MSRTKLSIDTTQVIKNFNRAAERYDHVAALHREVAIRLLSGLQVVSMRPNAIVELGCGTGFDIQLLADRYSRTPIIGVDIAKTMLQLAAKRLRRSRHCYVVEADTRQLPFADNSIDLAYSNLLMPWVGPLEIFFKEIHRVLSNNGLFVFTTFGPDTLKELRESWLGIDERQKVASFIDMHDIGDQLLELGFEDPVLEMELLTLQYRNVDTLWQELRYQGLRNLSSNRLKGLQGKQKWRQFVHAYEAHRDVDGLLPATFEIIYGHVWLPEPTNTAGLDEAGIASIPLDSIKRR